MKGSFISHFTFRAFLQWDQGGQKESNSWDLREREREKAPHLLFLPPKLDLLWPLDWLALLFPPLSSLPCLLCGISAGGTKRKVGWDGMGWDRLLLLLPPNSLLYVMLPPSTFFTSSRYISLSGPKLLEYERAKEAHIYTNPHKERIEWA